MRSKGPSRSRRSNKRSSFQSPATKRTRSLRWVRSIEVESQVDEDDAEVEKSDDMLSDDEDGDGDRFIQRLGMVTCSKTSSLRS
jgi:hypothetical protein